MADDISVRIGGSSSDAQKAITDVTQALKDGAAQMTSHLGLITAGFDKFKGVLIGATAILAGGAMFKAAMGAANDWDSKVAQLSKSMGIATEKASVMAVAINHVGLTSDQVSTASMMLSRQMNSNANAFKVLGVETKNTETGALRPISDVMLDVNTKLRGIKNTTEQNVAGMQVYGRSWSSIRSILLLTNDLFDQSEETAKRLHLIIGPEGIAQNKAYQASQRDVALIAKSLEIQVGNALLPVMSKLGKWMGEEGPQMTKVFTHVLNGLVATAETIYYTFLEVGNTLGGVAAAAVELAHGHLSRSKEILGEITSTNEVTAKKVSEIWEHAFDAEKLPPLPPLPEAPPGDDKHLDFSKGKDAKGPAEKDTRLQEWKNELEQMKEAEKDYFKDSKASDEQYWIAKLALVQGGGAKEAALRRQIEHELFNIHKQMAQEQRALDDEADAAKKAAGQNLLDIKKAQLQQELAMGRINEGQEIAGEQSILQQKYQIDLQELDSKLQRYADDKLAYAKLQEDKLALTRKYLADTQQLTDKMAIDNKKAIESMLSGITSAFGSAITGLIQKTTTFKQAFQQIMSSILSTFIGAIMKMVGEWAAGELAKTALAQKGSLFRTMLEKVGLVQTAAAETTASATTVAAKTAEAAAVIPGEAAVAAGGAASAVASVPYDGPEMAAAAYDETYAMVMSGMAGFAVGSWNVPGDMFTKIHKGEMIVPEQFASSVRDGGGLGGGGDVHLHVNAVDSDSVKRLFRDNAAALSEVLRRQVRNFAPVRA